MNDTTEKEGNPQTQATNTQEQAPKEPKMSLVHKIRLVVSLILLAGLITFVAQNSNKVEVEFLSFNFRLRIVFIILVSALIGALTTLVLMKQRARKKKRK